MTVIISPNLTRTSDGVDFKTGKRVRKIFHPNGSVEIWEINAVGDLIRRIQ